MEKVARIKKEGLFIDLLTVDKLLEFEEEAKQGKSYKRGGRSNLKKVII